jgi:hypothetical protein
MPSNQNDQSVYAAAQGRSYLRGELEDRKPEWVREFAGLIDDGDTLDLLNYYCSLWADDDSLGDFLDTRLAEVIVRSAATGMADRAFRSGNVSQLQGMVGIRDTGQGDGGDALAQLARRLAEEGTVALVVGPPGSGKTATTLDVARAVVARTGGHVIGNTGWDAYDAVVRSDREMLDEMQAREGQVLAVIDEVAQVLTSRGEQAQDVDKFARALKFVRKQEPGDEFAKRGSVLLVGHTLKDTGAELRRLATLAIQKPSRADPGRVRILDSEGGADDFDEVATFRGLTDTRENYPEHEASEFEILGADDGDGDDDGDALDADDLRRQERVRSFLLACKPWSDTQGVSQKDAAADLGYSTSWASDRKAEWERGEWNGLEDVPEPNEGETA